MTHLGMRKDWLDLVAEGVEIDDELDTLDTDGVEDEFIVIPEAVELLVERDLAPVLKKLKAAGWKNEGWTRDRILKEIDPRFIHHAEHFEKLMYGGVHADGTPFKGGGGLSWGGLTIKGGEAMLKVMGSFEYKKRQEKYENRIKFANFGKIARAKDVTWPEKARLLLRDQLKVHCNCPAYRYYYAYTATKKGFALKKELRPSKVTNRKKTGAVCKHLNVTLRWLGGQYSKMASELKAYYER